MARRNDPIEPGEKRPITRETLHKLGSIFRYMLPYRGTFAIGCVTLALSAATTLSFPRLAGELLDVAEGKSKYFSSLGQVASTLLGILFLQSIFSFIRVYTFSVVS